MPNTTGILPAVRPGILPGETAFRMVVGEFEHCSGRQDAAFYGRQDARRYVVGVTGCAGKLGGL
jgi:hypothetical protein